MALDLAFTTALKSFIINFLKFYIVSNSSGVQLSKDLCFAQLIPTNTLILKESYSDITIYKSDFMSAAKFTGKVQSTRSLLPLQPLYIII